MTAPMERDPRGNGWGWPLAGAIVYVVLLLGAEIGSAPSPTWSEALIVTTAVACGAGMAGRSRGEKNWTMAAGTWTLASFLGLLTYRFGFARATINAPVLQPLAVSVGLAVAIGGASDGWRLSAPLRRPVVTLGMAAMWVASCAPALIAAVAGFYFTAMLVGSLGLLVGEALWVHVLGLAVGGALSGMACGLILRTLTEPALRRLTRPGFVAHGT